MWKDEIVEEIHQIRDRYAKSFNYDLNSIFEDLRKKQAESGKEVVTLFSLWLCLDKVMPCQALQEV